MILMVLIAIGFKDVINAFGVLGGGLDIFLAIVFPAWIYIKLD